MPRIYTIIKENHYANEIELFELPGVPITKPVAALSRPDRNKTFVAGFPPENQSDCFTVLSPKNLAEQSSDRV